MTWNLSLRRANNHNCTTLIYLQKVLKPIEEADEVKRKFADQKKKIGGNNSRQHHDRRQGNYQNSNDGQKSGDKSCRKMGHNDKWKEFPDNRFGNNYQDNESNSNEQRFRNSRTEREITFEIENSCHLMIEDMNSDDDASVLDLVEPYNSKSEDENGEEDAYLLRNRTPVIQRNKKVPRHHTTIGQICLQRDANGTKNINGCFSERVKHVISEHAIRLSVHRRYTCHHNRILRKIFVGSRKSIRKSEGRRDAVKHR